ncbi:hypothetical protein ACJMK2_001998 [Sinanodonta woodiana]
MADALVSVVNRLEGVAVRLEQLASRTGHGQAGAPSHQPDVLNPFVIAYDEIISGPFAKFLECSKKIGGEVAEQCGIVAEAFKCQREFLVLVSKSKKPNQNVLQKLLAPTSDKIQAVTAFRDQRRSSPFFNHLSALSESIPALGWVAVEPTPGPYVKDMADAGMFYTNRVLKDFKDKDQTHVDWTKTWLGTLTELQTYIKNFHTTGAAWNPQGVDATVASKGAPPKIPAHGGAPPPPPGPPPPPPPATSEDTHAGPEVDRSALMKEISKGLDVTKGLKKVTDDLKTHKNPTLRISGPAPFKKHVPVPTQKTASKPTPAHDDKPPVLELQNKKWVVEYHNGNKDLVLSDTNLKQTVYMYKCTDSTLQVKGKVNSITLDNCRKVAIVFEDVVSSVEFVNCQSVQAQSLGKCPTLSIDKTDGCLIYLSKESLNAEIVTAKSSEMNVLVPKDDGDFTEFPIPEQFKTIWNGSKFVTGCTESV